ncbi:carboxylesterase [Paenibacillus sp. A3]|uniref:alpha/beta hydrolase n=1 Tax=Paenibacillus sp. A3 TaxID=1337054 RepID=UPI0006D55AE9|nr:alpha/beta fold hydrolase [Paenibacillus sp. A3]KPV58555.1 carboxylesterase [Paenibacillus sp. A3]
MKRVYKTTEPFRLEGTGERASTQLLLIHGFTGSPSELRRLGYYLNDLGYTVNAVLLPGHGTTPEDMIRTGRDDWSGHVLRSYDAMAARRAREGKIVAIGHSMGGLLALELAMKRKLDGVVSLAAPMFLSSRKTSLALLLQYFIKYIERRPTAAAQLIEEACTYDKTPVRCVVDLRKLMKLVKADLGQVSAPLFVGQGEKDGMVLPKSAEYIYRHVSSLVRQIEYYPHSSHGLLLDEWRERVYEDISRFLARLDPVGTWKQAVVEIQT